MNCSDFQHNLPAMLGDSLEPALLVLAEQHIASCPYCLEQWTDAIGLQQAGCPSPDISTSVLASIGLDACAAALDALCDHRDETLQIDPTLALHLESCPQCAALSHTFVRLNQELSTLKEMSVPIGFGTRVLARTSAQEKTSADTSLATKPLPPFVARILQRPRIALEVAYTLSLALVVSLNVFSRSNDNIEDVSNLITEARSAGERQGQIILGQSDELVRSSREQFDRFYETTYTQISTNSQKTQQWINEQAAQIMRTVESAQESLFSSSDQQQNI